MRQSRIRCASARNQENKARHIMRVMLRSKADLALESASGVLSATRTELAQYLLPAEARESIVRVARDLPLI